MSEDRTEARPREAGAKDRRATGWFSGARRGRRTTDREAEDAMAEAVGALTRLAGISQTILETVEGSALPALDGLIAQTGAMASDRRLAASVRSRMSDLKASAEHLRATFAALIDPAMLADAAPSPKPVAAPQPEPLTTFAELADRPVSTAATCGLRVLAVEVNGAHQLQLRAVLSQIGAEPQIVADGAAVIDVWRNEPCDLFLIDPEIEGALAAAQMIRAAEVKMGWSPTPIVALGGLPDMTEDEAAMLDGHVTKPVSGPGLIAAIEAALAAKPEVEPQMTVFRQVA
ncbi:hypothetical protein [Phenylobacterium sp.]|jgi:CheY-like chemotaxis protein|uniref:hypothetical protein n=1 Tax=Phenylobacterium sp. TaxID=1871053 RepID=UPI002F40172E